MTIRKMRTQLATYTISETIDNDGNVTIELTTTNPPRGIDGKLYSWSGSHRALAVPLASPPKRFPDIET